MYPVNTKNRPSVSIAMAVYNGQPYLREQIDSILCQLCDIDELVISLDPSNDGSEELLFDYASRDMRVKIFKNPLSPGVVNNFQNALENCKGEIIFYSDQDDIWLPNKVNRVLREFIDDHVSMVFHDCRLINHNGYTLSPSTFKLRGGARTTVLGNIFRLSYIGCSMAFRGQYKSVVLPIPTIYRSHDWWTGSICGMYGKIVAIPEILISHRIHSNNATPKIRPSIKYQLQVRWLIISQLIKRRLVHPKF